MSDQFEHDGDAPLERLLAAKGARWRRSLDGRLPAGAVFVARMRQRLTEEDCTTVERADGETAPERTIVYPATPRSVAQNGHIANHDITILKGTDAMFRPDSTIFPSTPADTSLPSAPVTPRPPRRRFAGLAAGAATLLIVALFAATLTYTLHSRQSRTGSGATPTANAAKTAAPGKTPTSNTHNTGRYDYRPLVIAPSDPQIVYNVAQNGAQLVRSNDGGATFHNVANPPTTLQDAQFTLMVSPLDANHVVAAAYTAACTSQGDPQRRANAPAGKTSPYIATGTTGACAQDYFSADGGQTWGALTLPFNGVIGAIDGLLRAPSLSYGEHAVFAAQEGRLYAAAGPSSSDGFILTAPGDRLVVSVDGGASWQLADSGLGATLCDFAAAPTGTTVYALTSAGCGGARFGGTADSLTLWRSDNAGASWARVNTVSGSYDRGMAVAPDGAIYINVSHIVVAGGASAPYPQDVLVSLNGGRTLIKATNAGLPSEQTLTGPMGLLSNGSVVMESSTGIYTDPAALYVWRPGASSWRQIGPQFTSVVVWAVVVSQHGTDTVYVSDVNNAISHFTP